MTIIRIASKTLPPLLLPLAAALFACASHAHDIVLVPGAKDITVRYGHPGDWQPVEERRLLELQLFGQLGTPSDQRKALKPQAGSLVLAERGAATRLAAARYDNGLWARVPVPGSDKLLTRNTTRLMLPEATLVTNNLKFAKALVLDAKDEQSFKRSVGHLLELVPQKNPATLAAGEALPVLVLLQGQPLAGAGIEVGDTVSKIAEDKIPRYATGADGIAMVPLRPRGVHMLGVDVERANDGSLGANARAVGADKIVMAATYTFVRR